MMMIHTPFALSLSKGDRASTGSTRTVFQKPRSPDEAKRNPGKKDRYLSCFLPRIAAYGLHPGYKN